ncbi:hypothetical protein AAVH_36380, partial [Aphelenchoides avenae]
TIAALLAVNAVGYSVLATVFALASEHHVDWSVIGGYVLVLIAHASVLAAIRTGKSDLLYIYFVAQGLYIISCAFRVILLARTVARSHRDTPFPSPSKPEGGFGILKNIDLSIYAAYLIFAISCFFLNIRVKEALVLDARNGSTQKAQAERVV